MLDTSALAALASETRARLVDEDARAADRRAGLTTLRPGIDYLEQHVRPSLEEAKRVLADSGVSVAIETGWTGQIKRANLSLLCTAGPGWPDGPSRAVGHRFYISHGPSGLSVTTKPAHDRDVMGDAVDCAPGQEVATAISTAVMSFLQRAAAGPMMRGVELRSTGRSSGSDPR